MTDEPAGDDRVDALLRTWGEHARKAAGAEATQALFVARPRLSRARVWAAAAAAAGVAAAVALASALIVSRGAGGPAPTLDHHTTQRTTNPPRPAPGGAPQQVTYRHLSVQVPASWRIDDVRCGSPQSNTVLLPIGTLACKVPAKPGITWVSFEPLDSGDNPIPLAPSRHLTVDGHPALEQTGVVDGDIVIRVVVPAAQATATIRSPQAAAARRIAATLSVVDQDSNGCPSESAYRPMTTDAPPARSGADQTLVPGNPVSMAVCAYGGTLLIGGVTVPSADLAADLRLLRDLPGGFSIAPARFNTAYSCTAPADPAISLDKNDPEWFAIVAHYRSGPDLVLRARAGFCGHLGISNGTVAGQDRPELIHFLFDASRIGGGYPPNTTPAQ